MNKVDENRIECDEAEIKALKHRVTQQAEDIDALKHELADARNIVETISESLAEVIEVVNENAGQLESTESRLAHVIAMTGMVIPDRRR
jgi:predicted  nucleic acid-binding Zn-ribbon protein